MAKPQDSGDVRKARLAKALKANLKKRKAAAKKPPAPAKRPLE